LRAEHGLPFRGGARAVQDLRAGDLVMTKDAGAVPVVWAGGQHIAGIDLLAAPYLWPVRIRGMGNARDVLVSPQHGILVSNVLVRAKHLAEVDAARFRHVCPAGGVGYQHLLLPQHALICAEGIWTESMYPGPVATRALGPDARFDLVRRMPRLGPAPLGSVPVGLIYGPRIRPLIGRKACADVRVPA
jgi:serralysin